MPERADRTGVTRGGRNCGKVMGSMGPTEPFSCFELRGSVGLKNSRRWEWGNMAHSVLKNMGQRVPSGPGFWVQRCQSAGLNGAERALLVF